MSMVFSLGFVSSPSTCFILYLVTLSTVQTCAIHLNFVDVISCVWVIYSSHRNLQIIINGINAINTITQELTRSRQTKLGVTKRENKVFPSGLKSQPIYSKIFVILGCNICRIAISRIYYYQPPTSRVCLLKSYSETGYLWAKPW